MQNINTGTYIVYAGILVSILAHFGWILSQSEAITIISGFVVTVATIYQHFTTKSVASKAIQAGVTGIKG